ncbi:MAG TPA: hypothetical protein VGC96_06915 [Candidatus Elarobacter sp.]
MTNAPDRLYELIPAVYRSRDAEQGYPLRALLRVVGEQADVVERDIAQLYENWFIETCEDWVVPYIAALIGCVPLTPGPGARRDVANTIRSRRRKGTIGVLQDLAETVGGWPARPVEFYRLLAVTQNLTHPRLDRGRTAELRDGDALDALGTAFDEMARNVDVRRVSSAYAPGTANIPEVGVFVWRLGTYTVTKAPAYNHEEESPHSYLFSALGNDTQLFRNPEARGLGPALPARIMRRGFDARDYGEDASVMIWTGSPPVPVAASRIVPADLSDWSYRPTDDRIAVDPELGRIVVPSQPGRRVPVWVSYSYGAVSALGGGEYARTLREPPDATIYRVGPREESVRIADALTRWSTKKPARAVIELVDSSVYAEPISIELAAGQTLELRAAIGARPVLRLLDFQTSLPDDLDIAGAAESWFTLDGLVITGRGLQISGEISGVTLRHCTLVPGWGIGCDCEPKRPTEASIEVAGAARCLTIDHSIVGAIRVERDEALQNPLTLRIWDSIVDATSRERVALGASAKECADAVLTMKRSTVIGQIQTRAIELAENSLLLGVVHACRRQRGCIRFCYLPPGSHTPRRYECQPDLAEDAVTALFVKGDFDTTQRDALIGAERLRVEPQLESTRYGAPAYCRLDRTCAHEIATGADDASEMGVYHDLYEPQRVANMRTRLDEFIPAGTNAGIIFAS